MAIGFENEKKNKINNLKTEREKVENFSKVFTLVIRRFKFFN